MTRTQKIWIGIGIGFILFVLVGFLTRDWLGPRIARTYVTLFYKNSVNIAFRQSFDPIDAQLRKHGIIFKGTPDAEAICAEAEGSDAWLMTNSCDIIQQSNSITLSEQYISNWERESPQLEQHILSKGWRKTGNSTQTIADLFTNRTNTQTTSVVYERKQNETKCILSIAYSAALNPAVFLANRECHRIIRL